MRNIRHLDGTTAFIYLFKGNMEMFAIPAPENFLKTINMDKSAMIEAMCGEFACKLFREGALSFEQGAEFCGTTIYGFLDMVSTAGIPVINYSPLQKIRASRLLVPLASCFLAKRKTLFLP
jgi:predicted HTH domain antitoxin